MDEMRDRGRAAAVSRRHFIAAGGAGLLSAAAPAVLAGAPNRATVTLGFIGCGGRGRSLLDELLKVEGVRAAALADPDPRRRETARSVSGPGAEAVADFRRILDRKDIDAVVIATPDHWHALPAVQALAAGKHVYVEKPLSRTVAEGRAVVEAARRSGKVLLVGTQQRSGEHFRAAVEAVRSGEIGTVTRARIWNAWNLGPSGIGNPPDGDPPPGVDYDLWLGPAPKRPFNPSRFHWNYVYFWDYAGGIL